jgi:hypothetical protein
MGLNEYEKREEEKEKKEVNDRQNKIKKKG